MLKCKNVLSMVLVVVMLFSVLAIGVSAIAPGSDVGFVLVADKTEAQIVPGAEVTVTLHFDMADWDQLMSDTKVAILYDSTVYTPDTTTRTFLGDWANYAKDATTAKVNAAYATTVMNASTMSDTEKAKYNSGVMLTAMADAGLGATAKAGYSVTQDTTTGYSVAECSIVFNVTGDAAAVAAGNKNITICDTLDKNQYAKRADGSSTPLNPTTPLDVSYGNILANMPAGPAVAYYKAQIKMTPDSATTVKDDFQFRVQSVITDADWDAYFAQTATADETKNAITEMGIVAYKGAGTFDEATAKALVTDGTAATDYATAGTTYVQKASDDADAYFGAIIKAKHSTMPNDVTYMGYVKYVDAAGNAQVIFYETAKTAALASNYDNFVSAYLAANPYQG